MTERSRVVLVPIDDVIYLKAELKYITIRTSDREFLLEESLTRLETEFGHRFVRVHRNCLVARDAIRGFERRVNDDGDAHWEVLLNGLTETLPVSRRQQGVVRDMAKRKRRRSRPMSRRVGTRACAADRRIALTSRSATLASSPRRPGARGP